jgi:transcriptional regulator with XRE-family HTH domain
MTSKKTTDSQLYLDLQTIGQRLQNVMNLRNIAPKDLKKDLGFDKSQVSRWTSDKVTPQGDTINKLASYLQCDARWIKHKQGVSPQIEREATTRSQLVDFQEEKSKFELIESNNRLLREKFKEKCCVLFDDFFDYIAETYGEDKDAVDEFLERLQQMDHSYASWLAQKKGRKENSLVDSK